jgi:hypothetical protein
MTKVDVSRIEQFRQLKKEIRGTDNHLIVGIDIAKSKHHAFFGTPNSRTVLKGLVVENSAWTLMKKKESFDPVYLKT